MKDKMTSHLTSLNHHLLSLAMDSKLFLANVDENP